MACIFFYLFQNIPALATKIGACRVRHCSGSDHDGARLYISGSQLAPSRAGALRGEEALILAILAVRYLRGSFWGEEFSFMLFVPGPPAISFQFKGTGTRDLIWLKVVSLERS